ncbi:MAG: T9SS type A sorting domain-containing protein, partial [Calditrichaeota bacterium]|nr:T9SS type A sorting domain-containing protein [Calditrichota bacterium]
MLSQNYPNPFNPSTEIRFTVAKTYRTTLEVYNLMGQKVMTLFDEVAQAGHEYHVRFTGSNLASGVYI